MESVTATVTAAERPRDAVRVTGPEAADYLQRMVSNDVVALAVGESCEALLLTPKARVIATLRVLRRGPDDYLLLTEPGLGRTVVSHLVRARFAARCEIEPETHRAVVILGEHAIAPEGAIALSNDDYGVPGLEVLDAPPPPGVPLLGSDELERLRIAAGTPRFGAEIDDRVLPAEAGLVERAVDFAKGCYPGQEPIARLHYRGHANRSLRVLELETETPPVRDAEIVHDGKVIGRVTSAVGFERGVLALGYVRSEVPDGVSLEIGGVRAVARRP
jgi:folate-binding protein YgfZ